MSLRPHLYGFELRAVTAAVGSKDEKILEAADANLAETFKDNEPARKRASAWLRTIINDGYPFRQERGCPQEPEDGGLLLMHMETDTHAHVVGAFFKATGRDGLLDLAMYSSQGNHEAFRELDNEMSRCGFTRTREAIPVQGLINALLCGTPLFGDQFRSSWSFYSIFRNDELPKVLAGLKNALDFQRKLPAQMPEEIRKTYPTSLSEGGKKFIGKWSGWFGQIHEAGQDAFIFWW